MVLMQVASIVPPILTCLIGKRLGDPTTQAHFQLRDFAASLIKLVCKRFGDSSHTLRPRLTRTCLKHFMDPSKPLGTHYGALIGLAAIGGREAVRILVVPNIKLYEDVIRPALDDDSGKKQEAEMVVNSIVKVLKLLEEDVVTTGTVGDGELEKLKAKIGDIVAERVWKEGREVLVRGILDA